MNSGITAPKYLENWKVGDDIGIMFEDIKKEGLTDDQLNELFKDIRSAALKHGFDLKMWGVEADFYKSTDKNYPKTKWKQGARAMIDKLIEAGPGMFSDLKIMIDEKLPLVDPPEFKP